MDVCSGQKTAQNAQLGKVGEAAAGRKETPMKPQTFGIEIEMNHITRQRAAQVVAETLGEGATFRHTDGAYDAGEVTAPDGRRWKLVSERVKKLIQINDPEEIKKGPNDVKRFMKRLAKSKNGEDAVVSYVLDEDIIAEEEKYDGFYAVATNLSDHPRDVLAVAKQRYKIEDSFRIMKTNFSSHPVYHSKQSRIETHFLTCYTALLVYRLLECKLNDQETHVTTDELINTLRNMNVVNVHDVEYMALYNGNYTLDALTSLTGMPLDRLHYKPKELNRIIKKTL